MMRKTIEQIANMIKIENDVEQYRERVVQGVIIDSRKAGNGELFVPFQGENTDGHHYVKQAIAQGAAAALWQKDVPNPPENLPILIVEDTLKALQQLAKAYRNELSATTVIGITGSNGKTTTKDITAGLLSARFKVQKTEGNYNNHIGLPLTLLSLRKDTEMAVIEMGMSNKGEIELLTNIASPDLAIITNIGESHLQDLGSREAIAQAKLEIIAGLSADGTLIYHGDEPLLTEALEETDVQTKTFGFGESNDLHALKTETLQDGSRFIVNAAPDIEFFLPVLGRHNVSNAMAAMLAAQAAGLSFEEMKTALASIELTKMRMEWVDGIKGSKFINDAYNASPTSMKAAIELAEKMPGFDRKILVLGDMLELGLDEELFHYQVGQSIDGEAIDYVFTFGRLGQFIAAGAKTSLDEERIFAFTDKKELAEKLRSLISGNELILVKASRGVRLEEVIEALSHQE
ncbi:UDP-N-acetylmuramoyl-tripeptide--D-alanyl-D-alanine ligase [Bacillus thermotolerans]|uniref:UDP-N-acetylmuramoyl-tripeptide--D-alanyl-D- alanine ligase n=1 Tax=Bacillus thermotolerans TaxID=1221996 RepID=UPI00057C5DBB|nr:UDP-N-acetylmuramoyl-tripeptide--D-alanyl-D-alanine ligase [Bacillus thermotolerans]KKB38224.1 UDP-N-acetylmuramoylalanyl-D-glutamyl-2,6-diaminopimelate--D-alanyl-D-alanine ligase [Bacillus thermotolerans]